LSSTFSLVSTNQLCT